MEEYLKEYAGYIGGSTVVVIIIGAILYRYNPIDIVFIILEKLGIFGILGIIVVAVLTVLVLVYLRIINIPGIEIPQLEFYEDKRRY